jgi:hypothetical protein
VVLDHDLAQVDRCRVSRVGSAIVVGAALHPP